MNVLFVAVGGMLGTLARYGTAVGLARAVDRTGFPFATLLVNLAGCFLIGYLQGLFTWKVIAEPYRLGMLVGFLGGFTTFSSFGWETTAAFHKEQYLRAAAIVVLNNAVGIALVIAGYALARGRV